MIPDNLINNNRLLFHAKKKKRPVTMYIVYGG